MSAFPIGDQSRYAIGRKNQPSSLRRAVRRHKDDVVPPMSINFKLIDRQIDDFNQKSNHNSYAGYSDDQLFDYVGRRFRNLQVGFVTRTPFSEPIEFSIIEAYCNARIMFGMAKELLSRYPEFSGQELLAWLALNI